MIEPEVLALAADPEVPNNPLPVLIYRQAGPADARAMLDRFDANGWGNGWRNGIYPFHHFHSITHEVLGIAAGQVTVRLGGETGRDATLAPGDIVVLPAGTGHKRLSAHEPLEVVGAYPDGRSWDLIRADAMTSALRAEVLKAITAVPLPRADPVYGGDGPLMRLWAR